MAKPSPQAGQELMDAVGSGALSATSFEVEEMMGATDCPEGCVVEPDGRCPHGYQSAALTMEVI